MITLLTPLFLLSLLPSLSSAQADELYAPPGPTISFRPSVAIVIGIFAVMFSLTFLLLMYAKFCHSSNTSSSSQNDVFLSPERAIQSSISTAGVDKSIIKSLPFFHFSALRGSRAGLECAVCLSPYIDTELLRLLPTCKHAFHLSCVDQWLEQNSSCPLCRTEVSAYSAESGESETTTSDLLSLFIEREPSFRFDKKKQESIQESREDKQELYDKFKHQIVISDAVFQSRWSALNSADLMSLNCDLLRVDSSRLFSGLPTKMLDEKVIKIKDEERTAEISRGTRSMSEVANLARFRGLRDPNPIVPSEDSIRRAWLPIAWQTMRRFAGKQNSSDFVTLA
ncbi:hypothetical protein LUZ60_011890 [Juncus effusus]|nr:hypothetical protein LUZ60_011890 [Juncus effusus]